MGRKITDMTGQRFGMLTVLGIAGVATDLKKNTMRWLCQCDCGSPPKAIDGSSLRSGNSKSCGCMRGRSNKKRAELERAEKLTEAKQEAKIDNVQGEVEVVVSPDVVICQECHWIPIKDDPESPHYVHCSQFQKP